MWEDGVGGQNRAASLMDDPFPFLRFIWQCKTWNKSRSKTHWISSVLAGNNMTRKLFEEGIHFHSLVFSLEGRAWQEPEPSHVTDMALAHYILGKFLGVVCHCFPPSLDVPTLAARCLRPQRSERSLQRKVELWARKMSGSNFCLNSDFHLNLGIFYMPQIYDMGLTA